MIKKNFIKENTKKILRIMRISVFFCFAFMVSIFAEETYSQTTKYSITLNNTTIRQAISEIERQSDYFFIVADDASDELNRLISLSINNRELSEILETLFKDTNLLYMISGRQVFISKSEIDLEKNKLKWQQQAALEDEEAVFQGIQIVGRVTDINGDPLPGASIIIKGTTTGIVSDGDGRYTISVPDENAVLQFSYVGFHPQEIPVGQKRTVNVTLLEATTEIDEVVVVAYGSQKKISVTGAISTVQTKELKQSSAANLSSALAGRLPGLTALQTSGQPGNDAVNLYLRGRGTTNGYDPLILIDGIPRSDISTLDPNEIASVSILKDASATAVFGVRGANGVLLITTRRGTEGKLELSVNIDQTMQQFIIRPDRYHSWEFAELRNQAARNDGLLEQYTPYMIDMYRSGADRVFYPDRNVFQEFFRNWSPQTRVNVNLTGGNDALRYFLNVGYIGQGGQFKTESEDFLGYDPSPKMDRYNFRANVDYNITKRLKLSVNLASYLEKMNSPQTYNLYSDNLNTMITSLFSRVYEIPPTDPGPFTAEGYTALDGTEVPPKLIVTQSGLDRNAYGEINRSGYRQETNTVLNSSLALDWSLDFITPGLSTKVILAYDTKARTVLQGLRSYDTFSAVVATTPDEQSYYSPVMTNQDESIRLMKWMFSYYYLNLQYSINYERQFGRHHVSAIALFQRDNWKRADYIADLPYNMVGLVGRATYGYDDRYLAEINIGYNGSEQFAPANRFGFFPALSLGWVVSNEGFLKENPILTNVKFRTSFGKVGNDKIGSERFLYNSFITENGGGAIASLNRGNYISQGRMGNEKIQWEIANKQNYGIDIQLFRSLSLTADVFFEKRDHILIQRGTVPVIQGVNIGNLPRVNMGEVDNQGYELELTWLKTVNSDLSFSIKGNYAYNRNNQVFMDEAMLSEDYAFRYRSTGYSIGQPFGYPTDYSNGNGYINTEEELDRLLPHSIGGTPRLGDVKYLDKNGDGEISDKDLSPMGYTTIPRITYGFSGALNYKNLDFSFLFTGIAQSSNTYISVATIEYAVAGSYNNWHRSAWTQERYENGEEILYPALATSRSISHQTNDLFLFNRDFLRLKNIEIGYSLPQNWIKPFGINRVRAYINGNNLWTWKKFPVDTIDPEQTSALAYPLYKMVNFGLNVVF